MAKKSATPTSVKEVEKNIREDQDGANVVGAMPHRRAREEKNVIDVNTTNNIHKFIEVAVKKPTIDKMLSGIVAKAATEWARRGGMTEARRGAPLVE